LEADIFVNDVFEVMPRDRRLYEELLKDFLPAKIIDMHAHVWLDKFVSKAGNIPVRTVTWPSLVAKDNSVEDLIRTYELLFPGKEITPLIFSSIGPDDDLDAANDYIRACSGKHGFPSLIFASPEWSAGELEERVLSGGFLGCKVYLTFSKAYIPREEIRIFDYLPHHQLEIIDKHGWIVMLHIPRDGRLKDPVNLCQMLEIEKRYPGIKLIIAHVGRAYCPEDIGNAFEILSGTKSMLFDISANTNRHVFEKLIRAVGPKRILFGSDLPITRMRTKRICENGNYINLVPKGLYGDISGDRHMREVPSEDAGSITFFIYEEIDAFRRAAENNGLSRSDIEDVFYNNAKRILYN